jgi:hypothetical protein
MPGPGVTHTQTMSALAWYGMANEMRRRRGGRKKERKKTGVKGKGDKETHIQSSVVRGEIGPRAHTADARTTLGAERVGDTALVEGVAGEGRGVGCFGRGDLGRAAGRPGDVLVGWVDKEVAV